MQPFATRASGMAVALSLPARGAKKRTAPGESTGMSETDHVATEDCETRRYGRDNASIRGRGRFRRGWPARIVFSQLRQPVFVGSIPREFPARGASRLSRAARNSDAASENLHRRNSGNSWRCEDPCAARHTSVRGGRTCRSGVRDLPNEHASRDPRSRRCRSAFRQDRRTRPRLRAQRTSSGLPGSALRN